ncbi:CUB and sushi domain-containing protein 1 [Elysia marginata]|uniref:CUB and sushi domain-containing protein 1 n=1 Tax=Elysia marginata TaxID=1093978 RepID=A0AAV4IQC6_9GAST|nr:CUB and sushi domain-containing protein 1 [Elysia marginata]
MLAPVNGHIKSRTEQSVTIACNPGFELADVTTSTRKCIGGQWYPSGIPSCLPRERPCQSPPNVPRATYRLLPPTAGPELSLWQVEYVCNDSYVLVGPSSGTKLTCRNGQWDGPIPTCGLMDMPPYEGNSGRPYNSADITDGKNKVSSLVIVVTTACSVLGVLLIIMAVMVFRRHKPRLRGMGVVTSAGPHLFQQGPSSPPYARVHNSSMDEHDRLALMAYVEASRVHLPTYEEAIRIGNNSSNVSCTPSRFQGGGNGVAGPPFDFCSNGTTASIPHHRLDYHQNHQYSVSQSRPGVSPNDGSNSSGSGNNNSTLAVGNQNSGLSGNSSANMCRDGVSVSEMFGSIDTVNVSMSDASTSVTVETYDSSTCGRSVGSSSQQATAGSLQSSRDQLADEDAPLLDSNSERETDVVSVSSNPSRASKDEQ